MRRAVSWRRGLGRPGRGRSVVFDAGLAVMLVLDAGDLTELARAEAPHHIPYGFHGQFLK